VYPKHIMDWAIIKITIK